jgi:hypothetical protein
MNNRLQRWGERALGQVRSVSPRIASRFEPELGVSLFEEEGGFQEIEAETPGRTQPRRIVSTEPVETSEPPSPQPNYATEQPAPVRVVKEEVPPPAATEPPSSQPRDSKPLARARSLLNPLRFLTSPSGGSAVSCSRGRVALRRARSRLLRFAF